MFTPILVSPGSSWRTHALANGIVVVLVLLSQLVNSLPSVTIPPMARPNAFHPCMAPRPVSFVQISEEPFSQTYCTELCPTTCVRIFVQCSCLYQCGLRIGCYRLTLSIRSPSERLLEAAIDGRSVQPEDWWNDPAILPDEPRISWR